MKTKSKYTVAKVLHWVAGFIIAFNLLSGWRIGNFPLEQKLVLVMVHSSLGLIIFALMAFRWWWRRSNRLYAPPRWWTRPSMLLQWVFYPLLLLQVVIGVIQAAYIDYEVLGFGFINFSAPATANPAIHAILLDIHGSMALLLITLVIVHGLERSRKAFANDGSHLAPTDQAGRLS